MWVGFKFLKCPGDLIMRIVSTQRVRAESREWRREFFSFFFNQPSKEILF
jgi:hypothetical protein